MEIVIGTKNQLYATIGHIEKDFAPVLWFKIGQRKQALVDLTNYFDRFGDVLATGIQFGEMDYMTYQNQFYQEAATKANEVIERVMNEQIMYKDKFFTYLPTKKNDKFVW